MYYPYGWCRVLRLPQESVQEVEQVVCNRDKVLTAIVTADSVMIWYVKPCVPIISHRRSPASVMQLGKNVLLQWKPDSSMLVVVTELGHLIVYHLALPVDVKTLYELIDSPVASLRRERDELFIKEIIPPLFFSLAFEVSVDGGISDLVAIREELMIATKSGKILRYSWEGQEIRDYSLDLRRIPFCVDQQVLKAVPIADKNVYVSKICYSPLIGGYSIVLNDGRAALLVASSPAFDPNSVTGVWALQIEDANCVALNHKYKLIAFGRKNAEGMVYSVDEATGGLVISHRLILPTRDYPGCPGAVSCLRWTPDGTTLAMAWQRGGFSIWSTFGAMIMCSLCWDYGPLVSDPVGQNPLCIKSLDWSAEGYQMWIINASKRIKKDVDPDFMPFPQQFEKDGRASADEEPMPLANKAIVLQFVKSPASVNPSMTGQEKIYLQGEDVIYLNQSKKTPSHKKWSEFSLAGSQEENRLMMSTSGSKLWTPIKIPHSYISTSWPIRYTAMDPDSEFLAVAGRTGFAHYCVSMRKWRLFGNETQEKDFIVTGGLLWWKEHIILGCYNLALSSDELRIYPRSEKLDNGFAKVVKMEAQVLLLNILDDQLVVFCSDSVVSIYSLQLGCSTTNSTVSGSQTVNLVKLRTYDASRIPGLNFHPASVVLVALSHLRVETSRSGNRESLPRDSSPTLASKEQIDSPSLILNICGRVVMIQSEVKRHGRDSPQMTLPTILASGCEMIWFPRSANVEKPHLTLSLWLYRGAHGMSVWLPVFPREGDHSHTFMSKRIMLHFPLQKFYPLAILFEDAIILGAESDTVLYNASSISSTTLPFSSLERKSLLFLHPILRQLIRRNLGYHAWEIARTCMNLPYFQHCLELLLHEVLEEEATSTEPIPDALLPSVVDFIQEFPVYHQTVGRCARKTEVALWPHLFSAVGSPKTLFMESLNSNDLDTAASYLLILQNLEPPAVAQNHATLLLDASLDQCAWDLARELVRFLRTIDPADVEEASQRPLNMPPMTPPINSSSSSAQQEEEISLLLGTLQVPRGGRTSGVTYKTPPKDPQQAGGGAGPAGSGSAGHKDVSRCHSDSKQPAHYRPRQMSCSSQKDTSGVLSAVDQTAEEFFIDVILQRHARKLLSAMRLFDLGTFSAQLDFHMVSWLKRESNRAARVENAVQALRRLHSDFHWPFPVLMNSAIASLSTNSLPAAKPSDDLACKARKCSSNSSGVSLASNAMPRKPDSALAKRTVSDSGYLSHSAEDTQQLASLLSEQTIHAMLKPHGFRDNQSVVSEDVVSSATGADDKLDDCPNGEWPDHEEDYVQESVCKGSHKAEVQLRYMLQIMLEANCLDIASIITVLLKDALALIRIVNVARSAPDDQNCVARLFQNLKAMEAWAQSECLGYAPFFQSVQPQLNSLRSYLLQNSKGGGTPIVLTHSHRKSGVAVSRKQATPRGAATSSSSASVQGAIACLHQVADSSSASKPPLYLRSRSMPASSTIKTRSGGVLPAALNHDVQVSNGHVDHDEELHQTSLGEPDHNCSACYPDGVVNDQDDDEDEEGDDDEEEEEEEDCIVDTQKESESGSMMSAASSTMVSSSATSLRSSPSSKEAPVSGDGCLVS